MSQRLCVPSKFNIAKTTPITPQRASPKPVDRRTGKGLSATCVSDMKPDQEVQGQDQQKTGLEKNGEAGKYEAKAVESNAQKHKRLKKWRCLSQIYLQNTTAIKDPIHYRNSKVMACIAQARTQTTTLGASEQPETSKEQGNTNGSEHSICGHGHCHSTPQP